jgi:hypothetical protein
VASQKHRSEPMNFQLLVESIPARVPATPHDGYLDFFNRIWLGYIGVSWGDLLDGELTVTIHPEQVAGSRSLRFVYPDITQIVGFAIK